MIRRPPRSTQSRSSAASDVYKRQDHHLFEGEYQEPRFTTPPPASSLGEEPRDAQETLSIAADRVTSNISTVLLKLPASVICVVGTTVALSNCRALKQHTQQMKANKCINSLKPSSSFLVKSEAVKKVFVSGSGRFTLDGFCTKPSREYPFNNIARSSDPGRIVLNSECVANVHI